MKNPTPQLTYTYQITQQTTKNNLINKQIKLKSQQVVKEERNQTRKRNVRELAIEISLTSLGSSQTLPLPHLRTLAASRF